MKLLMVTFLKSLYLPSLKSSGIWLNLKAVFYRLSPWCSQLNGSFISCYSFFSISPPSSVWEGLGRSHLPSPTFSHAPILPPPYLLYVSLLEGLPSSLYVPMTCAITGTASNEVSPFFQVSGDFGLKLCIVFSVTCGYLSSHLRRFLLQGQL